MGGNPSTEIDNQNLDLKQHIFGQFRWGDAYRFGINNLCSHQVIRVSLAYWLQQPQYL